MSAPLTEEQCVWTRLADDFQPLGLQPYRFQVGCLNQVAHGAAPFYPDVCPSCGKSVRVN